MEKWSEDQLTRLKRQWHLAKLGWVPFFLLLLPWIECREPVKFGRVAKFVDFEVDFKVLEAPQYSNDWQMHFPAQSVHFLKDVFANFIPTHFETIFNIFYVFLVIPNDNKQF